MGERVFQQVFINNLDLFYLLSLLEKGSKFIPCKHFNEYSIFKFILQNFEKNFNNFNSIVYCKKKSFRGRSSYTEMNNVNLVIDP